MSGPVFGGRDAQPFDHLLESADPWGEIEKMFKPHLADRPLQPSDQVAKNLAQMARHQSGREILEYIMDITLRLPLRVTGKNFQETALLIANRQGINGVAEVLLNAIKQGEDLLQQGKET